METKNFITVQDLLDVLNGCPKDAIVCIPKHLTNEWGNTVFKTTYTSVRSVDLVLKHRDVDDILLNNGEVITDKPVIAFSV